MDILEMVIYGASRSEGNYSACLTFYSSSLNSMAAVVVMYSVAVYKWLYLVLFHLAQCLYLVKLLLAQLFNVTMFINLNAMEMKHRDLEQLCEK